MARDTDALKIQKWAENGDVANPEDGAVDRSTGWDATYSQPGGPAPKREHFNELFREHSALGVEINTRGLLEWDSSISYIHPALVMGSDGEVYISVTDSLGIDPTTDASEAGWSPLRDRLRTSYITIGQAAALAAGLVSSVFTYDKLFAELAAEGITNPEDMVTVLVTTSTGITPSEIATTLRASGYTLAQVAEGLYTRYDATTIADALVASHASITATELGTALETGGVEDRQTASQLRRLGFTLWTGDTRGTTLTLSAAVADHTKIGLTFGYYRDYANNGDFSTLSNRSPYVFAVADLPIDDWERSSDISVQGTHDLVVTAFFYRTGSYEYGTYYHLTLFSVVGW